MGVVGAANKLLLIPLKSRSGEAILPFADSPIIPVRYSLIGLRRVSFTASKIVSDFRRESATTTAKCLGLELPRQLKLRIRAA